MKLTEEDIAIMGGPKACKRLQTKGFLTQDGTLTNQGKKVLASVKATLAAGVIGVPMDRIEKTWLHGGITKLVAALGPWKTVRCLNTPWLLDINNSFALYGKKLPGIDFETCYMAPENVAKLLRFLLSKNERLKSRPHEIRVAPHTFQLREACVASAAVVWLSTDAQDDIIPVDAAYVEITRRRFPTVTFYAKRAQDKTVLLGYVTSRGLGGIVAVIAPLSIPNGIDPHTIIPEKRLDWKGGDIGGKTN